VRKEDPLAAMGAYWADEREVTSEDLDLLQTMADAAALAIANVELQNEGIGLDLVERENAHRLKNIFTVALALVHQTDGETVTEYRDALTGRLEALEQARSAIFEADQGAVDVRELLHRLLPAYAEGRRFELHCDAIDLSLPATELGKLALIINELGANAAKYGALSGSTGLATVSCNGTETGLCLRWQEVGGPPVTPPSRTGFGTKLLQAIAVHDFGGHVKLEYPPEGFKCEVLLPLGK
jgi:two-component sensor histidine kinase